MRSNDKLKTYLHYHNTNDHKTYQGNDISQRALIHIFLYFYDPLMTWSCEVTRQIKLIIFPPAENPSTKQGKAPTYIERFPSLKPQDSLIT